MAQCLRITGALSSFVSSWHTQANTCKDSQHIYLTPPRENNSFICHMLNYLTSSATRSSVSLVTSLFFSRDVPIPLVLVFFYLSCCVRCFFSCPLRSHCCSAHHSIQAVMLLTPFHFPLSITPSLPINASVLSLPPFTLPLLPSLSYDSSRFLSASSCYHLSLACAEIRDGIEDRCCLSSHELMTTFSAWSASFSIPSLFPSSLLCSLALYSLAPCSYHSLWIKLNPEAFW